MEIVIYLLAIFSLTFLLKEMDGPFGIIGRGRNWLMNQPTVGVFFYKLFSCYYCMGWWSGIIIYLLQMEVFKFQFLILWGLVGAIFSLIMGKVWERISVIP